MGNKYVIDPKAKDIIDDAAAKIKKASEGYGFRTQLSNNASYVYFIPNDDYHLQLYGGLHIECIGWDNKRTFGRSIQGNLKPLYLCGYYTDTDGYTYQLSMPAETHKKGKVSFNGMDTRYPQVLLDNLYVMPAYYSYIQPNENVVLYMLGEVNFFNEQDLQRDGVKPILHLVFNLRINSTGLYKTDKYRGAGLDVMMRQYDEEAYQAGVFGRNSSMAGAILNEDITRPLFFIQQRGVDQFNRRIERALGYVEYLQDIINTVNRQRTEEGKKRLSHLDIDFEKQGADEQNEKQMGIIDYDDKKKTWSIAFPEVLLVQKEHNPLPKESFGAYAVRGYLTLKENKTLFLKNKEVINGSVYIRNEIEHAVDENSYYDTLYLYRKHKNVWDMNIVDGLIAKEPRNMTIQIEDMDFTENGTSLTELDLSDDTDKAELALVLYGNGIIGGKHVTVMTLRLRLKDITRDMKENGMYTFRFERYDEKTEPITAYFQDF